jgi:hypothetical protein
MLVLKNTVHDERYVSGIFDNEEKNEEQYR